MDESRIRAWTSPPYAVIKQGYAHLDGFLPEDRYYVTAMASFLVVSQSEEVCNNNVQEMLSLSS